METTSDPSNDEVYVCKSMDMNDILSIKIVWSEEVEVNGSQHKKKRDKFDQNGHEIVGYIRKSTGEKDDITRIRLLNQISVNLRERSLVTKVFASFSCESNQPLLARDLKKNTGVLSGIIADGDMQVIDFTGLTTNPEDLEQFLKNSPNIVKIIIDKLPYTNTIHIYNSDELLNSPDKLQEFKCRSTVPEIVNLPGSLARRNQCLVVEYVLHSIVECRDLLYSISLCLFPQLHSVIPWSFARCMADENEEESGKKGGKKSEQDSFFVFFGQDSGQDNSSLLVEAVGRLLIHTMRGNRDSG
ncbi:hypothetical protein PHYBLDRAFT_148864 [Phycomyces blakesleeanus NRRL 1555(-)]|uniref:Uncharacterized protein n=1 Tax=Phycomyces blakesleeanus (strain ATCC 8743b / DSM 1359 / FGSC 10004 / NBRC 33097 / NRRL 1555) TaxID=763407 RepID=A0A163DC40_PHYB8|nr:hypothetical protein PHYBLDRAFT_148864 [Phycomyces blakesleeanus NRRL 1555(-)]OAD70320.1 hypothetical protein PHYBLDRAFT_148864 [Phycomyces blakesleeanus NRRL 1555(-)]|eukprot:XP_018288360.1 hypothetical protein PHYBLDRAFT_148864 [Phycomyces blakesleeanus NRRL 1555(-)]